MVSVAQMTRPQVRAVSTHSSPVWPASRWPMAKAKGRATPMRPVMSMGGWKNMPGWVSSGLMPWPSGGVTASS